MLVEYACYDLLVDLLIISILWTSLCPHEVSEAPPGRSSSLSIVDFEPEVLRSSRSCARVALSGRHSGDNRRHLTLTLKVSFNI